MEKITKNTDGDTFRIDDDPTRVLGINTDESVAVNSNRNTQSGEAASDKAKVIAPSGTSVRTEAEGKGVFGRTLADVKINTAHGEVDYGLVALDQGISKYSIDHGIHPNPEQHDKFKEYYSDAGPYQYADTKEPLSAPDYARVATNIQRYTEAEAEYSDGNLSREDYEAALHAAYGNGAEVARFRYQNMQWQRKLDMEHFDGSDRMAYDWAHQSKENRDIYDRAQRNSHTGFRSNPEQDPGFWRSMWESTQTMFSALNDFAVVGRAVDLSNARRFSDDEFDVSDEELVKGVPPEWHDKVMQEAENWGDDAALQYRDNLLVALKNEEDMQDMPLATQIATAVPAILLSPMTLVGGAKVAQGTVAAGRSIDTILKAGRLKNLAIPAKVTTWATAGSIEAGISATPRYALEDSFTTRDMLNEMKYGALFGAAVPLVVQGASQGIKRINDHNSGMSKVYKEMQKETEQWVDKPLPTPLVTEVVVPPLARTTETTLSSTAVKQTAQGTFEEVDLLAASQWDATEIAAQIDQRATPTNGELVDGFAPKLEVPHQLTMDDIDYLDNLADGVPQAPKPPEEVRKLTKARQTARDVLTDQATRKMDGVLNAYRPKGSTVTRSRSKSSATVDTLTGTLTKSFTQTMLESNSRVANWIGDKLLELPEGYGGSKVREASAALEQHNKRTRYLTQTQPDYHKLIGQYAGEQGKRTVGKFMAQHMDGQSNKVARQFSRDIATVLEQRRQGRPVTVTSPAVLKLVDSFEASMIKMYDDLVDAGVAGFKTERRIKHYFPQLWDDVGIQSAVKQHGQAKVQKLLARGYMESKHNAINSMAEAMDVAKGFLQKQVDGDVPDGALPATMDARAKQRLDIDTTVTDGDLSIMDLMETDFSTVTAKYSNRAAGKVALANKGITSDLDQAALRNRMEEEGASKHELQLFDDAFDILMGRPTRDGLNVALREIKDAVAQSKMGGLGMAQAAEAGTVVARSLLHLVSDPKTFKKIWAMAGESTDNVELMRETQALSGISNEVHLLDRQAVHLDQNQLRKIGGVRDAANWIAGKATFGKWKAPAGYILGQGSGFNMVRRFERRLANASFMLDTAKTFKNGTGKMSVERMKDIGLDPEDTNLKRIFNDIVEYDENGIVSKLNIDRWDKPTLEKYQLAMYRDDAQMVQQTIGGEMPAWINKPAMTIIAQFKQQAILANKKQLTRQMQFADKEAVLGTMMNTMLAGLTRTAKFGTLGAAAYAVTGDESNLSKPWEKEYWQPEKYVSTFGFFPDMIHIGLDTAEAIQEERVDMKTAGGGLAGEIPMLGWMKDYYDLGTASSVQEAADAAKGVAILGSMQFTDIIYKGLEAQLED